MMAREEKATADTPTTTGKAEGDRPAQRHLPAMRMLRTCPSSSSAKAVRLPSIAVHIGALLCVTDTACWIAHPKARPHGSQNLFALYGLNDLARSVARTDPVTGEKINKLRKSYEGHIKALQIAGKPKAVKMEGVLSNVLHMPDEEYHVSKVAGHEMSEALDSQSGRLSANMSNLLDLAVAGMAPGPLPTADAARYRAYLATDEATKPKPTADGAPARTLPPSAAATPSHALHGARGSRPERHGSKRSYTDVSFQGYGEGFGDDVADSTGGEDEGQGGLAKRRRLAFERTSHQVEVGGVRR